MIKPPGRMEGGEILLDGRNLVALSLEEVRQMRLAEIALVAQGSMNSLNPVMRVGSQMVRCLKDHGEKMSEPRDGRSRWRASEAASDWIGGSPACTRTS